MVLFRTISAPLLASLSLAAATSTAEERADCQCTVDGRSADTNIFYNTRTGFDYSSSTTNIDTGASPYEFIGCGAHKFYYDSSENQVAGYPWKFCYTYGGSRNCRITEISQKHSLNANAAYRFCNGDYDCNATSNLYVQVGTVAAAFIMDETDADGYLQDWTNCCQECRLLRSDEDEDDSCIAWDFSVETMECRLFSQVSKVNQTATANNPNRPFWFYGTSGFDDAPVHCWWRNEYDTCRANFKGLFIASMVLGSISLLLFSIWYWDFFMARYGWTTDVTPRAPRHETRTSSGKGRSRTYQVTTFPALLVCRIKGDVRRQDATSLTPIIQDKKFFFRLKGGTRFSGIGQVHGRSEVCANIIFVFLSLPSMGFLLAVSFQVFLTSGGRFQAKYRLPGSGDETVWGIVACCLTIAMALAIPFLWRFYSWSQKAGFRSENTYIKPGTQDTESGDDTAPGPLSMQGK